MLTPLNEQLIQLRQDQTYTQKEFAHLLKIETERLSNYEQGIRQPDLELLIEIGSLLNQDLRISNGAFEFIEAGVISPLLNSSDYIHWLTQQLQLSNVRPEQTLYEFFFQKDLTLS